MALEARFKVGEHVLALEPVTLRYFGGTIQRVIHLPKEDGGPLYGVLFFADGENFPRRSFILQEQFIDDSESTKHQVEYVVQGILGHRAHQHGRLPCPSKNRNARRCKADFDYKVSWVGYDRPSWELQKSFVVRWFLGQA